MINRNALAVGLASATLLAGCGDTIGNSVFAGQGECLTMRGSIDLGKGQRVFAGGNVNFGDQGSAIEDRLQILNLGHGALQLNKDNGKLIYNGIVSDQPSGNSDNSGDTLTLSVGGVENPRVFTYQEGKASTTFRASEGYASQVALTYITACNR